MYFLKNEQGIITGLHLDDFFLNVEIKKKSSNRLSLRFNPTRTSLHVISGRINTHKIEEFIRSSEEWIRKGLQNLKPPLFISPGHYLSIFGSPHMVEAQKGLRTCLIQENKVLVVCSSATMFKMTLEKGLKEKAFDFFSHQSFLYAQRLGVDFSKIRICDFKSKWGSCSRAGILSYTWHLIFAPLEIAEYVCAHEVAHLREMNHSPRFWAYVKELCPFYKVYRKWLRQEGTSLFRLEWEKEIYL